MCLYVTYPLDKASVPNFLAPKATAATKAALLHFDYHADVDYTAGANAVPNGVYAVAGHPSERKFDLEPNVLYGGTGNPTDFVQLDTEGPIGADIAMHPTEVFDVTLVGASTQSHHYGETTCENVGHCAGATDVVGSVCHGTIRGAVAQGYCYRAADMSLQCGRALESYDRYSSTPTNLAYAAGTLVSRCPAGTPLTRQGTLKTVSLLVGGCMIASDANYKPTAKIHIPGDCATPADHTHKGCIFPGAINFVPGAVQPTTCHYHTNGCNKPAALNYNSEATVDDGSCVMPTAGCTLAAAGYDGVAADTPGYKSRYVGMALPNVGLVPLTTYGSVLPYTSNGANVLAAPGEANACKIAIEGCMDSAAANYDPMATVNSGTWCIPIKVGCMMPSVSAVSTATAFDSAERSHPFDGGALNFVADATVQARDSAGKPLCTVYRAGCTNATAVNFDLHATADDGTCFYDYRKGCLNPAALNFNCTSKDFYAECTHTERELVPTTHVSEICNFVYSPPPVPSPGFPPLTEGAAIVEVVRSELLLQGEVSYWTADRQTSLKAKFAEQARVSVEQVDLQVEAASVKIIVDIQVPEDGTGTDGATVSKDTISVELSEVLTSPETASTFIESAGVGEVVVLATPTIVETTAYVAAPPAPPDGGAVGGIIGGVVGGLVGVIGLGALIYMYMQKKKTATYPA